MTLSFVKLDCILKDLHKRKVVPFFCLTVYRPAFATRRGINVVKNMVVDGDNRKAP